MERISEDRVRLSAAEAQALDGIGARLAIGRPVSLAGHIDRHRADAGTAAEQQGCGKGGKEAASFHGESGVAIVQAGSAPLPCQWMAAAPADGAGTQASSSSSNALSPAASGRPVAWRPWNG